MIRAIIFDVGGVIIHENFIKFFGSYEKKTGWKKEQLYEAIVHVDYWDLYNRGKITEDELENRIAEKTKIDRKILREMRQVWRAIIIPYPEVIQIAKKLKKRYKIYALSNVDRDTIKYINDRWKDVYGIFDGCVLSCEVGITKPDPAIFKYLLKKFGLKEYEALFIDNFGHNIVEAEKLGIKSVKFENPGQLKMELRQLGIRL